MAQLEATQTIVKLCQWQDLEVQVDEMWGHLDGLTSPSRSPGSKKQQRWLWHAVDHGTGKTLAYVWSNHQDRAFLALKTLLEPLGIMQFYTDGWSAYERHLDPTFQTVGKTNTQAIERKHLTLRPRIKRLARKTICFSKSIWMHDIVIGLFINRYEFGLNV